ncbi:acyltransferase [Leifsonia flava]|uniref:Acyltransferase n=1 Tax=Orlajensenia leifsoniae TaxID=2561933 RepID=A0A4Y9QZL8_9MICO|nr:DapH/DapD/GlmU-related protein [Leifsonia flava]TFV96972.1 acyltransferase [Leifsonia flava]
MGGLKQLIATTIAPSSLWSPRVRVRLLRFCGVTVGTGTRIRPGIRFIERVDLLSIGDGCFINVELLVGSNSPVVLGDRVSLGPRVQLVPTTHEIGPASARAGASVSAPITIGDGTWIGAGTIVLGGVTIGSGCIVAAGSVVTADCEPDSLYGGTPARRIRALDVAPEASSTQGVR